MGWWAWPLVGAGRIGVVAPSPPGAVGADGAAGAGMKRLLHVRTGGRGKEPCGSVERLPYYTSPGDGYPGSVGRRGEGEPAPEPRTRKASPGALAPVAEAAPPRSPE